MPIIAYIIDTPTFDVCVCVFVGQVVSSAIVDKYIGESARLIREMFGYARDHQPCIIFMDEIDAIGKQCTRSANAVWSLSNVHIYLIICSTLGVVCVCNWSGGINLLSGRWGIKMSLLYIYITNLSTSTILLIGDQCINVEPCYGWHLYVYNTTFAFLFRWQKIFGGHIGWPRNSKNTNGG